MIPGSARRTWVPWPWRGESPPPAAGPRSSPRRPLRPGGGRAVPDLRRPQGPERGPWRADHARRLRGVLARHARRARSVRRAPGRDPADGRPRARALRRALRLRGPLRRGDPDPELAAGGLRPLHLASRPRRPPVDRGRAVDPHDVWRPDPRAG